MSHRRPKHRLMRRPPEPGMPLWLILVIFGVLLILGVLQAFPDVAANPSMLLDQIPGL